MKTAAPAAGDVFHLTSGGSVEGELIAKAESAYTIRTTVGIVTIPADAVRTVEEAPSAFAEYRSRCAELDRSPESLVALAVWCRENGLAREARQHLQEAVGIDPACEPARRALGHVKIGDVWVDGSTQRAAAKPRSKAPPESTPESLAPDDEKLVAAVQAQWTRRLRAIRSNLLESSLSRLVQDGIEKIRAVDDPLAILPLTRELGSGSLLCRELLVERLSRFPQDESTLNLAGLALLDPEESIRIRAVAELARRDDPRIVAVLRSTLDSANDVLIARAAYALGRLKARAAVPDLINCLTASRVRVVEVPLSRLFLSMPAQFGPRTISLGARVVSVQPQFGVVDARGGFGSIASQLAVRRVTVYRTEALEALKEITGMNFGFDVSQWMRWQQEENR